MASESRHLSVWIDRPLDTVYGYASNPANLAEWAAGLGSSVEKVDGQWVLDTPEGQIIVAFAPQNEFGVLDHYVTTPSGEKVYVPLRVIAEGDRCEVVFTLRRAPGMSDADFERDETAVAADLATLKKVVESR
ncbi:MAG TPA: hypothetical protein VLL08_22035 [Kineosporiaceae bacterium]|nr:hypothetical protein [Kineosporiaceae bacterium]